MTGMLDGVGLDGTTTNETLFDALPSGFCTTTFRFEADCTSKAASVVQQANTLLHVVVPAPPEIRIVDPGPGLDVTKFAPSTRSVNPPAASATALDGSREVMIGEVVIVTVASPVRVGSAELVATTLKLFGEGADAGAW